MVRAPVLTLVCLLAGAGTLFATERTNRFEELRKEYAGLERKNTWPDVRRRRDVVRQLGKLPAARRFLLEVFRKDRELACRVPAMEAVGRAGELPLVKSLLAAAIADRNDVYVMLLPEVLSGNPDPGVGPWLTKACLRTKDRTLRAAVIETLGRLREPEAFDPLLRILEKESDLRILYEALLALARIGGTRSIPAVARFLGHENDLLRAGAVRALAETGDPEGLDLLVGRAEDPYPGVREEVAVAIGAFRALDRVPVLIRLLECGRLRVMATARRVLEGLTGQKLGFDPQAWKVWWAQHESGRRAPPAPPKGEGSISTFYGMNILSDRVTFLIDTSGSMNAGRPSRIETARKELEKALDQLNRKARFNVVGFSGSPVWWAEAEREATPRAVADAKKFITGLTAGGETNLYDTLVSAFERNRTADTIYLLGDGCPSAGRVREHDEIIFRIAWLNRMRRVQINTIALVSPPPPPGRPPLPVPKRREEDEQEAAALLARIAATSGGTFLRIDR